MAERDDKNDIFRITQNKRKFDDIERESEEVELTLGLSLNGRFGIDPTRLVRSSSVSEFVFSGGGAAAEESPATADLARTWSMPAGTEDEWRRRKELQSARRMEAKRKRVEKMMSEKVRVGARVRSGSVEENGPIGERHVAIGTSQGSGSSGRCDGAEGQVTNQGTNILVENRSSGSVQAQQNDQKQTVPIGASQTSKPSSAKSTNHEAKEMMKNMMVDMPCVSTRGVGPSGKRIEGFLYRYKKGEEVRIVCVCHGSFLSPAEFVKHAGGGDVAQPLKHIVVNPAPLM